YGVGQYFRPLVTGHSIWRLQAIRFRARSLPSRDRQICGSQDRLDGLQMIIAGIEISHHRLKLDTPFHASWDTKPRVSFDATIVRVTTDTGLVGVGSGDRMLCF